MPVVLLLLLLLATCSFFAFSFYSSRGERCDLLAVVSCFGTDCDALALSVSGTFEWGRGGNVALAAGGSEDLAFTAPGFPDVTAYAASNNTVGCCCCC